MGVELDYQMPPFHVASSRLELPLHCMLTPGWQRVRVQISTKDHPGIRKSLSLQTSTGDTLASLHWMADLDDDFLLWLERPIQGLRLTIRHARGRLHLRRLQVARVSALKLSVRAVQAKLKLLRQFRCMTPVLKRGGRLLMRGDFAAFQRKLLKALPDSRSMRLEALRALEACGSWWRRRTVAEDQRSRWEQEVEALNDPIPLAVLMPVDPTRVDHARQAAFSVLRQVYPHWQLRILWPGRRPPAALTQAIRHEERARLITSTNLAEAARAAIQDLPYDRVVLLSPDAELADQALLRLASTSDALRHAEHLAALDLQELSHRLADQSFSLANAFMRELLGGLAEYPGERLAYPLDLATGALLADLQPPKSQTALHLAGNFVGISGWDALAYQILHGLDSVGVQVFRHPAIPPGNHTLPPGLRFDAAPRRPGQPMLIVAPPFQVKRFAPDEATAVFTMWECDRLPAADVAVLNRARLVIVPSQWVRDCFQASGVHRPMEIVPLGYDPQVFYDQGMRPTVCTFGTAGALGAGGLRKNIGMVIEAFRQAFPNSEPVRLRIKLTPHCAGLAMPNDQRIDLLQAWLPPMEVAAWYRSLTAYVNASLAEGFGLHLLEAMACGVPLISTRASGPADYFDDTTGIVLPHRNVAARNEIYEGTWYEPDFTAMVKALRQVYEQGTGELPVVASARARAFTWRDTGRSLWRVCRQHGLLAITREAAA